MHEAKTRLSELVRRVEAGERVLLARRGVPVAEIVRREPAVRRVGGTWRGAAWISPDFDEPTLELEALFLDE